MQVWEIGIGKYLMINFAAYVVEKQVREKRTTEQAMEETASVEAQLREAMTRDMKIVQELEQYLRRNIMQLYDRQRELDLLKVGLLDSKAEAEGLGRLVAQSGDKLNASAKMDAPETHATNRVDKRRSV